MFNEVVELITAAITTDNIGQEDKTLTYSEVFAEKNGIPRAEFFSVGVKDIKPAVMFKIREADYSEQSSLRFNGKIYTIYRVYPTKNEMIELYCEVRVGG